MKSVCKWNDTISHLNGIDSKVIISSDQIVTGHVSQLGGKLTKMAGNSTGIGGKPQT